MKIYVEAYDEEGGQILGNLDGQTVVTMHSLGGLRRKEWFRRLATLATLNNRVHSYRVVTESGRELARVLNLTHPMNHRTKE